MIYDGLELCGYDMEEILRVCYEASKKFWGL